LNPQESGDFRHGHGSSGHRLHGGDSLRITQRLCSGGRRCVTQHGRQYETGGGSFVAAGVLKVLG
jgi:hypothetical protein